LDQLGIFASPGGVRRDNLVIHQQHSTIISHEATRAARAEYERKRSPEYQAWQKAGDVAAQAAEVLRKDDAARAKKVATSLLADERKAAYKALPLLERKARDKASKEERAMKKQEKEKQSCEKMAAARAVVDAHALTQAAAAVAVAGHVAP